MHRYARNRHDKCPATMCKRSANALAAEHESIVAKEHYKRRYNTAAKHALEAIATRTSNSRVLACYVCGSFAGVVVVHKKHVMWGNFDPATEWFEFELVPNRSHGLSADDVRHIVCAGMYDNVVFKVVNK